MNFNDFLSAALGIVSIATLAGLGFMRGTVTNLREQLKDSREETRAVKEGRAEDQTKLATVTADLAALTRVVTGEAHWVAISDELQVVVDKIDEHHEQAMGHWERLGGLLTEIRDSLRRREP